MFFLPALLVFLSLLVVLFWAVSPALAHAAAMAMRPNIIATPVTRSKTITPPQIAPPTEQLHREESDTFEDEIIDLQRVRSQVDTRSVRKVEELVQAHQKEALAVIRGWMTQNGH